MCLAFPGKVAEIDGSYAQVDFDGIIKKINIELVKAQKGDYVIVHAGFAIEKMQEQDALETIELIRQAYKKQEYER